LTSSSAISSFVSLFFARQLREEIEEHHPLFVEICPAAFGLRDERFVAHASPCSRGRARRAPIDEPDAETRPAHASDRTARAAPFGWTQLLFVRTRRGHEVHGHWTDSPPIATSSASAHLDAPLRSAARHLC
jgi:hypothetical protein